MEAEKYECRRASRAVGLLSGLYKSILFIRSMAASLPFGIIVCKGTPNSLGKRKPIWLAKAWPCPQPFGVPITLQIFIS